MKGRLVAVGSHAGDDRFGKVGEMGVVAEGLAPMDVREVDLDEGQGHARQRIADRHAGVRVGGRIDEDLDLF